MKLYNILLEKIVLPIGDLINGSSVIKNLKLWRNISERTESEIEELAEKNLLELLDFITLKVPFYTKYREFKSQEAKEWIKKLPIMDKTSIKENIDSLTSVSKKKLIKKVTSGSSGIQGITYMDERDQSLNRALQILWWEWGGWSIGTPILQTGMTAKRGLLKSVKDILLRTKYYVAFGLSDQDSLNIIKKQRNKKDNFMGGYASSLYVLASIAKKNNIKDVKFKGAISWGDKMFPHFRKQIEESFGCKVADTYGCSEGLMIASQKDLDYYYIMSPHVYLELVDKEGNEVADGNLGYVVATRLDARSMPLVRYYTGDLAVKLPREKYPLKRDLNYPLLEKVVGRDTDIVYTKSGKYMIVHFFTGIFEFETTIKQFRVIQNDLDSMTIEYIIANGFDDSVLLKLENIIHDYLKENFLIIWKKVESIESTASGKPQIIKSYIGNRL